MLQKFRIIAPLAICVAFFVSFLCMNSRKKSVGAEEVNTALTVWQIDSFEGGKGSRADYLQNIGKDFSKKEHCYINVVSLTAEAARLNLANGNIPDIVSYGAGMCGIESYVTDYTVWCRGVYCLLSLDTNCDFSDVNTENTVINKGKDNFSGVVAVFNGLENAVYESSTSAYVKLINGEYKYLLGTQRDIFRLRTRNVAFSVKPITVFNDLYQNLSITTQCKYNAYAQKYIDYVLSRQNEINRIGMFSDGGNLYNDELSVCENLTFEYKITYPISEEMKSSIEKCVSLGDINMLKEVLK